MTRWGREEDREQQTANSKRQQGETVRREYGRPENSQQRTANGKKAKRQYRDMGIWQYGKTGNYEMK
jgi:hypothetical protein